MRTGPLFVVALLLCCTVVQAEPAQRQLGVLVVAHGGAPIWNAGVKAAVDEADLSYPTAIAFGMGMRADSVQGMQAAVQRLYAAGVTELLVVPLLVSSHSMVYRQYEFLFGMRAESSWPEMVADPLSLPMPARLGAPLDQHPYVSTILGQRAQDLSQQPAQAIVVLVAHGPVSDDDDRRWIASLKHIAAHIQQQHRFADVRVHTLRDDADPRVRAAAHETLRRIVADTDADHHVLVVPVLMARGGIEHKIREQLAGLEYALARDMLLPHPLIGAWIRESVEQLDDPLRPSQPTVVIRGEKPQALWYNACEADPCVSQNVL